MRGSSSELATEIAPLNQPDELGSGTRIQVRIRARIRYPCVYLTATYLFFSHFFFTDIVVDSRSSLSPSLRILYLVSSNTSTKSTMSSFGLDFKGLSAAGRTELAYEIGLLQQMNRSVHRMGEIFTPKPVVKDGCPEVHRAIVQRTIDRMPQAHWRLPTTGDIMSDLNEFEAHVINTAFCAGFDVVCTGRGSKANPEKRLKCYHHGEETRNWRKLEPRVVRDEEGENR
jgi:hypothetical protein